MYIFKAPLSWNVTNIIKNLSLNDLATISKGPLSHRKCVILG